MKINFFKLGQTLIDEDDKVGLIPSITNLSELNDWEHENIIEGRRWALNNRILNHYEIFDVDFLLLLHKKMFGKVWKWAGELRRSDKNIGCDYTQIRVELKKLCDDAKYWQANNIYSIAQIALIFHHKLVKIHLFANGNGRHARLVCDCIIKKFSTAKNEIKKINWRTNEIDSIEELRKKYIEALRKADKGDYQELFQMFLRD